MCSKAIICQRKSCPQISYDFKDNLHTGPILNRSINLIAPQQSPRNSILIIYIWKKMKLDETIDFNIFNIKMVHKAVFLNRSMNLVKLKIFTPWGWKLVQPYTHMHARGASDNPSNLSKIARSQKMGTKWVIDWCR